MTIAQNLQNSNRLTDWIPALLEIDNEWGYLEKMGLFTSTSISQLTYTFDEVTQGSVLLVDKPRGERSVAGSQENRKTHAFPVPHFPYNDAIKPEDIQGVRRDTTPDQPTTLEVERMKVLRKARKNWATTLEYARMQALKGNVYAPNGTVSINWYTEFGKSQQVEAFDFTDTTVTNDMVEHSENVIAHIQDNLLAGDNAGEIVALCSPTFFGKLIKHPNIREAYLHYAATNQGGRQPLRDRLGMDTDERARQFEMGGITYVEYRGAFSDEDGTVLPLIETDTAYAFPVNVEDMYQTIYAPANRFSAANQLGESQYVFEKYVDDVEYRYDFESNFLNMINRPQAVVKLTA